MHIGSALRNNHRDTFPPFGGRALPTSRTDGGDESDDPFGPPDTDLSTNSLLGSIQRHFTGTTAIPKSSEVYTTPVSYSIYPLFYSDLTLVRTRLLEIPTILIKHAGRSRRWNNRSSRKQKSQGAQSSTVIPWGLT